jgi:hypothetical protein
VIRDKAALLPSHVISLAPAAEHAAFNPDTVFVDEGTTIGLAVEFVTNEPAWFLWWD